MQKEYYVYILSNKYNAKTYIGVTSNIRRRLYEHKHPIKQCHTSKYNINKLVYVETTNDINDAIAREKQLKRWSAAKKRALIESLNPSWNEIQLN